MLNYQELWKKACERAERDACLLFPEGPKRKQCLRELARRYYREYITP